MLFCEPSQGYEICDHGELEEGFEKVAIYAVENEPKHAARQLPSGKWTSKLGLYIDLEHLSVANMHNAEYGRVVHFLKRPINNSIPNAVKPSA